MELDIKTLQERMELAREYYATRSLKIKEQIRKESGLRPCQLKYYARLLRDPDYNKKRRIADMTDEQKADLQARLDQRRIQAGIATLGEPVLYDLQTRCCFAVIDLTWKVYGDKFVVHAGPISYDKGRISKTSIELLTDNTCKELDRRNVAYLRDSIRRKIQTAWR